MTSKRRDQRRKPAAESRRASPGNTPAPVSSAPLPTDASIQAKWELWPILWVCAALIVVNAAVYAPVWHHDFVGFDDPGYVTENPNVAGGLSWHALWWGLTSGYFANWHPLTWWSHMLDIQLYGLNPGPHHLTSLLFHVVNSLLLFGLFYRATAKLGRSAFVAALFAVHPVHVESVAWVAERKDVLSALFWFLTCWAYIGYVRKPRLGGYVMVAVLLALGLMAKPMLVTLPFVLLLLDVWPLGRVRLEPGQWAVWLKLAQEKIPLLGLAFASSVVTFLVQRQAGAVQKLDALTFGARLENAFVSYVAYIGKMLWPARLAVFYPYQKMLPAWWVLVSVLLLAGLSIATILRARPFPYLLVGWLWYLGTLVPVIGLVQVGEQAMADRYTYIPLVGLFVIIAWGVPDLLSGWRHPSIVLPAGACLIIAACAIGARAQVHYWKNSVALWQHTVDVTSDNYFAQNNLGFNLGKAGKHDEEIAHYNEALRIRPNFVMARTNLALALAAQGKFSEAVGQYQELLRLEPLNVAVMTELGFTLAREGKEQEAIAQYSEALRLKPDLVLAHTRLGNVLVKQHKVDEALVHYNEALRLDAGNAEAHNNLGVALANLGKITEAAAQFSEALRLKPDYPEARRNLGIAQAQQNR